MLKSIYLLNANTEMYYNFANSVLALFHFPIGHNAHNWK